MSRPNRPRYAARLNAFRRKGETVIDMIGRAAEVGGLDAADLNYPDHFADHRAGEVAARLADAGMAVNGLAMRYYTDPGFRLGAFTHPDRAVRRKAIDQTRDGIDTALSMGARLMTLWMGQDGFDYAFQMDYARAWDDTMAALEEVCAHAPECGIALEYKPNEPRAFALMPDVGTTLLACREVGRENLGVTLDFAHVLYADEMPAHSAYLVSRHSRLMGLHLNDGYAKRDDGLMAGSVHPVQTVELLVEVARQGYDGVIYFDTFPDMGGLDPVAEARASIAMTERLKVLAGELYASEALAAAIARQDAAASSRIVAAALYGA
ncbi:sugar phosphate isomerase/epimerase [Roseibacterium sp. SDUM158017]|uniref:sugar phosphate isomerase/epimerase family protein n=1 Tax=Roseicyclus salinarum TaxID=3036773 RepID=UPI002415252B|nr:sugar phosphate isomerase/epimerase family protein [Roseibacterium sp. SDUM158017]MDG4649547.1 sugar phosphate isomerase/epimerase [Roseibacterium sp. SDUM158017]